MDSLSDRQSVGFSIVDVITPLPGFEHGYYRILVEPTGQIKYLAFSDKETARLGDGVEYAATYGDFPEAGPPVPDIQGCRLGFVGVPGGEWNVGHLQVGEEEGRFSIGRTEWRELDTIDKAWHPRRIDRSELEGGRCGIEEVQGRGQMYCAVYGGRFGLDEVMVCTEWYPDSIYGIAHETEMYEAVEGQGIGPVFVGHVTENRRRVIGYMVERVDGRAAGREDVEGCCEVLGRLHRLGIGYGRFWEGCFLCTDKGIVLHGFGGAYRTSERQKLQEEMDRLRQWLG